MSRKLPDDQTVIDLYTRQRMTMPQIAERYGTHATAVRMKLIALGVERRPRGRVLPDDPADRDYIEEVYRAERSQPRAAAKLGISLYRFRRLVNRHGLSFHAAARSAKKRFPIASAELRRLYVKERRSMRWIARKYGCSTPTIYHKLKKLGLSDPSRRNRWLSPPRS